MKGKDRKTNGKKTDRTLLVAGLIGAVLVFFITAPIVGMFVSVGWSGLKGALNDTDALRAIGVSMLAALYATLLSMFFGVPLAYFLARKDFPAKSLIESVIDLPIVIPHTVAGIAILVVFGRGGFFGSPLDELGIRISDSMPGIVLAMLFVSAPFFVNSAREGFGSVDPRLENVARGLGASRFKAFWSVTLPLSKRHIFAGAVMTWARAVSEFGAVVIIAYFPMIAPTYIYDRYLQYGIAGAEPAAALLLLVSVITFVILRTISKRWGRYENG